MKILNKHFHSSDLIYFTLGEQGMERSDKLVHSCNHSLPVGESSLPFLVVVGVEDDIMLHTAVSHQIEVFAKQWVSVFGYPQGLAGIARFIDPGICSCKSDDFLIRGKLSDVGDFGKEMGSGQVSDTRNGSKNFHLAVMKSLLELYKGFCELIIPHLACEDILSTVTNHSGTVTDADGILGKFFNVLYGYYFTLSTFLYHQSLFQLLLWSTQNILGTAEETQELQQSFCEDVERKQFRKSNREIAFKNSLRFGKIFRIAGSASGKQFAFAVLLHPVLLHGAHVCLSILSDSDGIQRISLGSPQGLPVMKVLDEQWINDTGFLFMVQEKVVDRQVVTSSGLHHKQRCITDLIVGEEGRESCTIEGERSLLSYSLRTENAECSGFAGNVQCDDTHGKTSYGLQSRSRFPFSRLKEAHRLNQPIGKFGTEDRLLLKFKDLYNMWSSVPVFYHYKTNNYRYYS